MTQLDFKRYKIGVDVGGTNTDSVLLDVTATSEPHRGVLASQKHPTTPNVTHGITAVIESLLAQTAIDKALISSVNIGTTVSLACPARWC